MARVTGRRCLPNAIPAKRTMDGRMPLTEVALLAPSDREQYYGQTGAETKLTRRTSHLPTFSKFWLMFSSHSSHSRDSGHPVLSGRALLADPTGRRSLTLGPKLSGLGRLPLKCRTYHRY